MYISIHISHEHTYIIFIPYHIYTILYIQDINKYLWNNFILNLFYNLNLMQKVFNSCLGQPILQKSQIYIRSTANITVMVILLFL